MENPELKEKIKLTQYSRGAGCGCKISPKILEEILDSQFSFPGNNLIVGNNSGDDAAVFDLGNGQALISTTDFFMPIVDDAFDFGRVAAANAISDVYAMGGKPVLAIAILGWPVDNLPASLAKEVMEGAKTICSQAGIALAGGHSIDSAEPFFGLSVNGVISIKHLKKNDTAREGDVIFLTKALGVGILSTAQKRGVLKDSDLEILINQLTTLNATGSRLGEINGVTAMTDVTGFGLAGHLSEMAEGSGLSAQINYPAIPIIEGAGEYLSKRIVPDATYRNWNSYSNKISFEKGVNVMEAFSILPDPQTNGGLLVAVAPEAVEEVKALFVKEGLTAHIEPVGVLSAKGEKVVTVSI